MELQHATLPTRSLEPAFQPSPDAGATEALASCRRMADAADAVIDQVYSGDAEGFLSANKQDGGQ